MRRSTRRAEPQHRVLHGGSASGVDELLTADEMAPTRVRRLLRGWLEDLDWPTDATDDLVLAANEAVSNTVAHAYPGDGPGPVTVRAELIGAPDGARRVVVTVDDSGVWREPRPGRSRPWQGLRLMRAVSARMDLRGTAAGTHIKTISRPDRES